MHYGVGSSQGGTRRVGPAAGGEAVVEAIGTLAATLKLTLCNQHAQTVAGRVPESSQGTGASTSSCFARSSVYVRLSKIVDCTDGLIALKCTLCPDVPETNIPCCKLQ